MFTNELRAIPFKYINLLGSALSIVSMLGLSVTDISIFSIGKESLKNRHSPIPNVNLNGTARKKNILNNFHLFCHKLELNTWLRFDMFKTILYFIQFRLSKNQICIIRLFHCKLFLKLTCIGSGINNIV